jgi:type III secretion protein R
MATSGNELFQILALMSVVGLLPSLVVMVSCFAKMSVVLFLVRNALGIQQTPPNVVLYSICFILSIYVMSPVLNSTYGIVRESPLDLRDIASLEVSVVKAAGPLKQFLDQNVRPESRTFFLETTKKVWAKEAVTATSDDFIILIPSFMASELTKAFEIGFLLYLPFLLIDFVVSTLTVAMGMQQMSPNVISTPFKLLLFVLVDGWNRLMQGLVLSYGPVG